MTNTTIKILWMAYESDRPFNRITQRPQAHEIDVHPDFPHHAVDKICENYFGDSVTWDEWFSDNDAVTIYVEILEPIEIAGFYRTELTRVMEAVTVKIDDPRPET